jgi:hypothetical protein
MRAMSFPAHDSPPLGHPATWKPPAPVDVKPPKRRSALIVAAALGVLALIAGTGLAVYLLGRPDAATPATAPSASSSAPFTAAGTLHLKRGEFSWNSVQDPTCQGLGGYSDLRAGTQVLVTDATGKKLAVGALAAGRAGDFTTDSDGTQRVGSCALDFAVAGIPRGVGPYGIEVSHRGVQNYTEAQLDRGVTLGFN